MGDIAIVEQETVRSVVDAFTAGEIKLGKPRSLQAQGSSAGERSGANRASELRVAPGYVLGGGSRQPGDPGKLYSALTVAEFLGWTKEGGDAAQTKSRHNRDFLRASLLGPTKGRRCG